MMFPNRLARTDLLASLGRDCTGTLSTATRRAPLRRPPLATRPAEDTGGRRDPGVTPRVSRFATAVVVVFSLGAFLFFCGICMLLSGLGDSSILRFLGVASLVSAALLTALGWTLCILIRRKRSQQRPAAGCVSYYTAVVPKEECGEQPPAYSAVDAGFLSIPVVGGIPSPPYSPVDFVSGARSLPDTSNHPSTTTYSPLDGNIDSPHPLQSNVNDVPGEINNTASAGTPLEGPQTGSPPVMPPSYDEAMQDG